MAQRSTITAVLIARNEQAHLPACLQALGWVDQTVVVVDAASEDQTEMIARTMASDVLVRPFDNFAAQRNAGLEQATGDWILSIDADERVSPPLAAEIQDLTSLQDKVISGYRIPIHSTVLGRPFRFSGTQNDRPIRLFRRNLGHWQGEVHEVVAISRGQVSQTHNGLDHSTLPNMRSFLAKLNHYTTLEADRYDRLGRSFQPLRDLGIRPAWTFARLYLAKQGFRDGLEGLAFCLLSSVSVAVRHWKHRERILQNREACS